jgi:pimeloyl-ACP methyl ester carboxylesterase
MFVLACTAAASARERMEPIEPRAGIKQNLYVVDAQGTRWATAILYVGGEGMLGPANRLTRNFLMRIREQLAAAGIGLIYPGLPSDRRQGLGNSRSDDEHVKDAAAIVAWAHAWSPAPIFLIGTSRGTVSAVNIAAHLPPNTFAGVALTSSVTRRSRNGEYEIDFRDADAITAPALVMHHREDACGVTPPGNVPKLVESLKTSSHVETIWISGGSEPQSDACEAMARHGYIGVESEAADKLVDWMKSVAGH